MGRVEGDTLHGAGCDLMAHKDVPFTLDLRSGRKNHLLLATVTGIAPYVSYVRTIYQDWKKGGGMMPGDHRLFCIQGASRGWEFGYRDELEKLASEAPWFKYVPTVSRPWDHADWPGLIAAIAVGALRTATQDPT